MLAPATRAPISGAPIIVQMTDRRRGPYPTRRRWNAACARRRQIRETHHQGTMNDTIIIGAGAAGLFAARELARAGKQVVVLESSARVGGRMLTALETAAGVPVEMGAEFVHGDAPVTTKLLDEARLATVRVSGKHFRSDKGQLSPQGPIWERVAKVFAHMNEERKQDRSFQEFLDGKPGGASLRAERELARGFIQGFDGADPALISEKSLATQGNPAEGAA